MVLYSRSCGEKSAGHQRCKAVVTRNVVNFKEDGTLQRKCACTSSLRVSSKVITTTSSETRKRGFSFMSDCRVAKAKGTPLFHLRRGSDVPSRKCAREKWLA